MVDPAASSPVLMVTDRWDASGGGRERYLCQLRVALVQRGFGVTVLARESIGERQLRRHVRDFRQSNPASPVLSARPLVGATHYQLHSGLHRAAFEAERDALDSALRRLFYRPALSLNARRQRLLNAEARILHAASETRLMAFSATSRDEVLDSGAIARDRLVLDRPGVDLNLFHPASAKTTQTDRRSSNGKVCLLFAGYNFLLKGLRWGIEAVAISRRQGIDVELVVAGAGNQRLFSHLIRRLNIAAHIRFVGAVDQKAMADLYRRSDALIHPTFYDPFPRVIVEALASGVPVITTDRCGGAELVSHGRNGCVVADPRDVGALSEAIALVANPKQQALMSAAAAEVGRCFNFESHADITAAWLLENRVDAR